MRGSALKALETDTDNEWTEGIMNLMKACDEFIPARSGDGEAVFDADRGRVHDHGTRTVVTGRVERGQIHAGEEVELVGMRDTRKTVATSLEMFARSWTTRWRETTWECCFENRQGRRGAWQVVAKPKSITPHKHFKGEVYVLKKGKADATRRFSRATSRSSTSGRRT